MIKVSDLKLMAGQNEEDLYREAAFAINTTVENIKSLKILRKAVDARREPLFVYTVAISLKDEKGVKGDRYDEIKPLKIDMVDSKTRPLVVGMGPGGLFAAYILARAGMRPIIIERGKSVDERKTDINSFISQGILNERSNIQFGEGGAGTFSDGKLNTGIKSPYIKEALNTFFQFGAPEEVLYSSKPHIGSDLLPAIIKNIRQEIIRLGGEVHFSTLLSDIIFNNEKTEGVVTDKGEFYSDTVVLSIGHSARDTFKMLFEHGIEMIAKPFSVGARIEHLQSMINHSQYGRHAKNPYLPTADYKLSCHLSSGLSVYTFCMCPGGYVSAATSERGCVVTNGFSLYKRDGKNANSALLVGVTPEVFGNHPLAGIEFQRKAEKAAFIMGGSSYKAPCQTVRDFLRNKPSVDFGAVTPTYERGVVPSNIGGCLPQSIVNAMHEGIDIFARKIYGFNSPDAVLTAPETRSSSPLRIVRDKNGESSLRGLYPVGEGSGYAGGIMSSAVDGIKTALSIIRKKASERE